MASNPTRFLLFVLQFATVGLALAFVVTRLFPERFDAAPTATTNPNTTAAPAPSPASPASYATAVQRATPSVVNIYARRVVTEPAYQLFGDPTYQRFKGTLLMPPRRRLLPSLGSGVIVRSDGYVLTNNHVVADAQGILVGFGDGRTVEAQVVGSDRETDLAVLKIDAMNLPAATIASSSPLAVGDVVLAIGNPFGIGQTVTLGIVSATGRNQMNLSRYEDFIQTDAAINVGNSGGALVNAAGELVGINTALYPGQGISFAIPAPAANRVMTQIIEHGYVIRGWIGAEYADTPLEARTESAPRGAQVQLVLPGGPAAAAGLEPRDILLRFNGQPINDEGDLRALESSLAPGTKVSIEGLRAGVPFATELTLIQRGETPTQG